MKENSYSYLPQIEKLVQNPLIDQWCDKLSKPLVVRIAADAVGEVRNWMREGHECPEVSQIVERIHCRCSAKYRTRLRPVVNATGVVLHTNLGRSPLPAEVWLGAQWVNIGYSNLEFDLNTGGRGKRSGILPELLSVLVESETAVLVNNCAAAVFLMLTALSYGRKVIVSRGEQIQIGGGFRIPEILRLSGAELVEVGPPTSQR